MMTTLNPQAVGAQTSLFVGDLSIFCTEEHLHSLFQAYGHIDDAKIIRCETTHKNLCYGFVKFSSAEAAAKAMKTLNGQLLCGRPLRIRWAAHKAPLSPSLGSPSSSISNFTEIPNTDEDRLPTASVHVTYFSNSVVEVITEEHLQAVFRVYGEVVDIIIKRFELDETNGWQRGYGFVHFPASADGVASAMACVDELRAVALDGVHFKCSVSHKLQALLTDMGIAYEEPASGGHHHHSPRHFLSQVCGAPATAETAARVAAAQHWTPFFPPMLPPEVFLQHCPLPMYNFLPAWAPIFQHHHHQQQQQPQEQPQPQPFAPMPAFLPFFPFPGQPPQQYPPWSLMSADYAPTQQATNDGAEADALSFEGPSPWAADQESSKSVSRQNFKAALQASLAEYDHGSDRDDLGPHKETQIIPHPPPTQRVADVAHGKKKAAGHSQ